MVSHDSCDDGVERTMSLRRESCYKTLSLFSKGVSPVVSHPRLNGGRGFACDTQAFACDGKQAENADFESESERSKGQTENQEGTHAMYSPPYLFE